MVEISIPELDELRKEFHDFKSWVIERATQVENQIDSLDARLVEALARFVEVQQIVENEQKKKIPSSIQRFQEVLSR